MYIPKAFQVEEPRTLRRFIERYSFATLVSTVDGTPFATHLPLLLDQTLAGGELLLGHVARANPQWYAFDGRQEALAIFQGPHAYVSPSWYTTSPAVPTWNYTAVHVYGVPRLMEDAEVFSDLLDRLIAFYESGMPQPWPGVLPTDFRANLMRGIVGFTMDIRRIEGKFKLSQNRSQADQRAVVTQLTMSPDSVARELGELAREHLNFDRDAEPVPSPSGRGAG